MYTFPYQGHTLIECVDMLTDAYRQNKLSAETMSYGVESLRNSPDDMRQYVRALMSITKDAVLKDKKAGIKCIAQEKLAAGVPIDDIAKELVVDHLRRLINHYNTTEVHTKWNAAIPELKTSSGFSTFF